MPGYRTSLLKKFLLTSCLIIVPSLGLIFFWTGGRAERQTMTQVMNQARLLVRQIILTRQWVSDCGGVFVHQTSKGAENTTFFMDQKIQTTAGLYLNFTPSMVTKKLSEYSRNQGFYRFRLSSQNPLNQENTPDPFEAAALDRFNSEDVNEFHQIIEEESGRYLQVTVPLRTDSSCLNCHTKNLSQGDIAGGLSVFLPVDRLESTLRQNRWTLFIAGAVLIGLNFLTMFFLLHRSVLKPIKRLEEMTWEISQGNYHFQVDINTGDEFERLGRAFNSMAERITHSRDILEEQVAQATRDLSEANRELQTLDQLKSDFLAHMSHELRSPLTALRGGVDYLKRTIVKQENRQFLEIMDKNVSRLIRLVTDLFDFTKIEAKKVEWSFERENMAALVQEIIEFMSPLAEERGLTISYDFPGDVYTCIDLERMEQVLVNLMDNALKYSPPAGEIRLQVKEEGETVLVLISDQGPGIPKEHLENIFEKFHTLPSSGGNQVEGTGLGLAICKGIIDAHGGRIWAESEPGLGLTVLFRLPREGLARDPGA